MRIVHVLWLAGLAVVSPLTASRGAAQHLSSADPSGVPVPAWFQAEMRSLVTGDSARNVADNRQWMGAQEPYEAYGQRYWTVMGGKAVRGVLFGIEKGKEGSPFINFLVFWHPEGRAIIQQWDAWGGYAEGELKAPVGGVSRLEQEAWGPDGVMTLRAHDSSWESGRHVTVQISWENGAWVKGRTYTWVREATPTL